MTSTSKRPEPTRKRGRPAVAPELKAAPLLGRVRLSEELLALYQNAADERSETLSNYVRDALERALAAKPKACAEANSVQRRNVGFTTSLGRVRISRDLRDRCSARATEEGKNFNDYVREVLTRRSCRVLRLPSAEWLDAGQVTRPADDTR